MIDHKDWVHYVGTPEEMAHTIIDMANEKAAASWEGPDCGRCPTLGRLANKLGRTERRVEILQQTAARAGDREGQLLATIRHLSFKMESVAGTLHAIMGGTPAEIGGEALQSIRALHAALTSGIR